MKKHIWVRTCLDAVGYEVEIAENGEIALEAVRRKPDLILLDLVMPKFGLKSLIVWKIIGAREIPVVVLTAKRERKIVSERCWGLMLT